MAAPLQTAFSAGALSRRQALCTRVPEAEMVTHPETLTPPRTVEQPQGSKLCSISLSFVAALLQTTFSASGAGACSWQQALSTRVPEAETSTDLESLPPPRTVEQR